MKQCKHNVTLELSLQDMKQLVLILNEVRSTYVRGENLSVYNRWRTAPKLAKKINKRLGWEVVTNKGRKTIRDAQAKVSTENGGGKDNT